MTVAVATLTSRAAKLLQDEGAVRWSAEELIDWASEGQVELVKLHPDAYTVTVLHQLVEGAKQTAPTGSIDIIDVRQNENGVAITPCERQALDKFYPKWMTSPTASQVQHWMDDQQPDTFYVYPAQNSTPAKVVLTHATIPPQLSVGGNIFVRDIYQENLVNYMVYRGLSKDAETGNAERAAAYYQLFSK